MINKSVKRKDIENIYKLYLEFNSNIGDFKDPEDMDFYMTNDHPEEPPMSEEDEGQIMNVFERIGDLGRLAQINTDKVHEWRRELNYVLSDVDKLLSNLTPELKDIVRYDLRISADEYNHPDADQEQNDVAFVGTPEFKQIINQVYTPVHKDSILNYIK